MLTSGWLLIGWQLRKYEECVWPIQPGTGQHITAGMSYRSLSYQVLTVSLSLTFDVRNWVKSWSRCLLKTSLFLNSFNALDVLRSCNDVLYKSIFCFSRSQLWFVLTACFCMVFYYSFPMISECQLIARRSCCQPGLWPYGAEMSIWAFILIPGMGNLSCFWLKVFLQTRNQKHHPNTWDNAYWQDIVSFHPEWS